MFETLKDSKKLASVIMTAIVIAPLAGCFSAETNQRYEDQKIAEKNAVIEAGVKLKSICVNVKDEQVQYILERFNSETLTVLNETLALNPAIKCDKVAHVIKSLPAVNNRINQDRIYGERAAILNTAFSG